jgi:hypothetical protein
MLTKSSQSNGRDRQRRRAPIVELPRTWASGKVVRAPKSPAPLTRTHTPSTRIRSTRWRVPAGFRPGPHRAYLGRRSAGDRCDGGGGEWGSRRTEVELRRSSCRRTLGAPRRRAAASLQQLSRRHESRASFAATPAITRAVIGSAHHQPASAFRTRPTSSPPERQAQSVVWRLSLLAAGEPSASPTRALAAASGGIVARVNGDSPIPTQLALGSFPVARVKVASMAM